MKPQTKTLTLDIAEFKMTDGEEMKFAGYASVFGGIDAYGDTIDPKAYDKTLKRKNSDRPIAMKWNHYGPVIGKWTEMRVDEKGLYVEGELTPGHSVASDVWASMKHGSVYGMSIGYFPRKTEEMQDGRRLLKEIELVEVSVVEDPADMGAKITDMKSVNDCATIREIERYLRDVGEFSKAESEAIVGRIKALALGDQGAEMKAEELSAFFDKVKLPID